MKTTLSILAALGLASLPPAMAQVQSAPQPSQEVEAAPSSGASGSTPSSQSDAGSGSATDSSSGASSPTDTSSGASSGASNAMQSEAGAELRPPPSPTAHLKPVTQDDVTYLCGGVGTDEATFMKQAAKDYDLMLTFATRSGDYLADVDVDIKDAKGDSVLQAACDSPIMLVDLPRSGSYRVRAEAAGYTLNKTVRVTAAKRKGKGASLASTVLTWPQQAAESGGGATSGGSGSSDTGGTRGSGAAGENGAR